MLGCFQFYIEPEKLYISLFSLAAAILSLFGLRKLHLSTKAKISLIYSHLLFLSFPFVLMTTNIACGTACMPCYNDLSLLVGYSLPGAVLLATIAGFFVIPGFYIYNRKKSAIRNGFVFDFMKKQAKYMKIKTPNLYLFDSAKPSAFSFRSFKSAIFLSAGLFDIMKKKEVESIILHELYHIKKSSSAMKFSSLFLKIYPFSFDMEKDENDADLFAISRQGTNRHIRSAKNRIKNFESIHKL